MSELKIIPLGGMGKVTQNMYLYEIDNEILIVDCGIGFPDWQMLGIDILIPDIRYLLDRVTNGAKIVGMVLTHGHDDHIAATPYILPSLPDFPIFASRLTASFAKNRMSELEGGVREIQVVNDHEWVKISDNFSVKAFHMTHSVPDTKHYFIKTPAGVFYHGADFKLDKSPVDGRQSELDLIKKEAKENPVTLMLMDCLRVEKDVPVQSESTTGPALLEEMENVKGKIIVTLMSSHIHRIQQVIDNAQKLGRKVAFIGRSVEQNVNACLELGLINIGNHAKINKKNIGQHQDRELCLIVAGSQGQEGSSLVRAVYGEHPVLTISGQDKVIFSADVIPGNEIPYYDAIDELSRNRIEVIYPEVNRAIHASGHASAPEQRQMLETVMPKYVMPIGGADRHRERFVEHVAESTGYQRSQVLLPVSGEIVVIKDGQSVPGPKIKIEPAMVDGLGIGDVGARVLEDRRLLSEAGMIVVIIPEENDQMDLRNIQIVSRGFVFMKEADEVIEFIKQKTAEVINKSKKMKKEDLKREIERNLARELFKVIERHPVIMAVFA